MQPACTDAPALRDRIATDAAGCFFDRATTARYGDLAGGTSLGGRRGELAGRSVLLAIAGQLTAALALIELDGCARRIVILPPDVPSESFGAADRCGGDRCGGDGCGYAAPCGARASGACRLCADDRGGPGRPVTAAAHRVGDAHLRHHRPAENGAARFRRSDRGHRRRRAPPTAPPCGARSTTSAATAACRSFCARFSAAPRLFLSSAGEPVAEHPGAARASWRHASLWNAVALAPRADEFGNRPDRAALRAAVGRDRRSGGARRPARRVSGCRDRPRLRLDRGRRRLRRQ